MREEHGEGPRHHAAELPEGVVLRIHPAIAERATGVVRPGFTVDARGTESTLEPGRRVLTDSDGRKIDSDVL